MIDSVNNSSTNSLLRAQQASTVAAPQKQPTIINQTRSAAVAPVKASSVPQTSKLQLAGTSSNQPLPRGSIVDRLV